MTNVNYTLLYFDLVTIFMEYSVQVEISTRHPCGKMWFYKSSEGVFGFNFRFTYKWTRVWAEKKAETYLEGAANTEFEKLHRFRLQMQERNTVFFVQALVFMAQVIFNVYLVINYNVSITFTKQNWREKRFKIKYTVYTCCCTK